VDGPSRVNHQKVVYVLHVIFFKFHAQFMVFNIIIQSGGNLEAHQKFGQSLLKTRN
jgi:hypothetical protein